MSPQRETEKSSAAELSKIYRRSSSDQYMPILLGSAEYVNVVKAHICLEDLSPVHNTTQREAMRAFRLRRVTFREH